MSSGRMRFAKIFVLVHTCPNPYEGAPSRGVIHTVLRVVIYNVLNDDFATIKQGIGEEGHLVRV